MFVYTWSGGGGGVNIRKFDTVFKFLWINCCIHRQVKQNTNDCLTKCDCV